MAADLLEIAKSGIFSTRKSLKTAGHNIANANTEGFSRQRAIQHATTPVGTGNLILGTGAEINKIERVHDEFVQKRLNTSITQENFFQTRAEHLQNIETLFNEVDSDGFTSILSRFFNSFKELSNQPDNDTIRALVRENAKTLINDFRHMRDSLDLEVRNIDNKLDEAVTTINSLVDIIAHSNIEIKRLESGKGETGDLRDRRDSAISKLSKFFAIKTYRDNSNRFVVLAKGFGTLVSGSKTIKLKTASPPAEEGEKHLFPGAREIFIGGRKVGHKFQKGRIEALLKTRNEDILTLQKKIDETAFHLGHAVNAIHRRGYVNKKIDTNQTGNPTFRDNFQLTGINFFKAPSEIFRAAEKIDLSDDIKKDLNNIKTALSLNSPGDNRVALAIAKLSDIKLAGGLSRTLEEDYLQSIGALSLAAKKAGINHEQAEGILAQTNAIRERISGVSIDEETANMVKFQHAYDASARVMQVADEMMKSILEIKR